LLFFLGQRTKKEQGCSAVAANFAIDEKLHLNNKTEEGMG
jgi:hypothetical protein